MSYIEKYENWINSPYLTDEEKAELESMGEKERKDAFYRLCPFGTAGMRGVMGPGTNRINRYTVRLAARAMALMLLKQKGIKIEDSEEKQGFFRRLFKKKQPDCPAVTVVIAYDTRNNSREFAEETAKVLAASGIRAKLFRECTPVPVLSFAVRYLKADGGVVITASHNTSEYNGFKVYDETGCQLRPELAEIISSNMESAEEPLNVNASGTYEEIGDEVSEAFMEAVSGLGIPETEDSGFDLEEAAAELKAIYTPLHGSGRNYVTEVLRKGGFKDLRLCSEQADFNGDFPTVKKPNPEDADALKIACDMAIEEGADLVIGTDPDCDRIGVAVISDGEAVHLSGNQVGALLIDYLAKCTENNVRKKVITTIVTSEIGAMTGLLHGFDVIKTLTGFKYIGDIMNEMESKGRSDEFLLGYEESYGYLVGTHARDKDGISAALVICRMAAYYKKLGMKLTDALNDLYSRVGFWLDKQESFVFGGAEGDEKMRSIMARLRVKGEEYEGFTDYKKGADGLPPANVLKFTMEDSSWIAVRPSGTEPKIKVYYCIRGISEQEAENRQKAIAEEIGKVME